MATTSHINTTMASDRVTTPPNTKATTTSDPAAIPLSTTPSMASDIVTASPDRKSFASLPREIRDMIYRLAIPHSEIISLRLGPPHSSQVRFWDYRILLLQASNFKFVNEARAMLFQRNSICIRAQDLRLLLGEDGLNSVSVHAWGSYVHVILKGSFDVKPWLREVVFKVSMKDKINELPGLIGFLLECSALRRVEVSLYRGHSVLRSVIGTIVIAFKALAEKLGERLVFSLALETSIWDGFGHPKLDMILIGGLGELETMAHDVDSRYEDEESDSEDEDSHYGDEDSDPGDEDSNVEGDENSNVEGDENSNVKENEE